MLSNLDSFISHLLDRAIAFFIAAYLFLGGLAYGNEPPKVDITYQIKPITHIYESGDKIEIEVTTKNTGRPFTEELVSLEERNSTTVYIQTDSGIYYLYDSLNQDFSGAKGQYIIKCNQKQTYSITFTIPDDAPKGKYNISFYYKTTKTHQTYADAIEVK